MIVGMVFWISMEFGGRGMFNRSAVLGPIVTLEGGLLQTVKDFTDINRLDIRRFTHRSDGKIRSDLTPVPMIFEVQPQDEGSPSGYAMNIYAKNGFIHLPAGGQVNVGHRAGRIDYIHSTMPLRTLSFDEVMALARQIDDNITTLGLEPEFAYRDMTEEEFQEKIRNYESNIYAKWRANGRIEMRIKPFSGYARVAFTTPIGSVPDKSTPETYLLSFSLLASSDAIREMSALREARSLALTGEKEGDFPVKIWFEDPDWRPEGWQGKWIK